MRGLILLLPLIALLSPALAPADEAADAYQVYFSEIGKKLPVAVMPKAECISILETAFHPEETIAAGLNALDASKNQPPLQACLSEVVSSINSVIGWPSFSEPLPDPGKVAAYSAELKQKQKCYNPYKPGDYYYDNTLKNYGQACEGKWLSEEAFKKLEAEAAELARFTSMIRDLPDALVNENSELKMEYDALNSKIDTCGPNPYSKSSYYYKGYAKDQAKHCKHVFSEAETKTMKKKLAELVEKYENASAGSGKKRQRLNDALYSGHNVADEIFDRRKELIPLARAVACTSPYETGSGDDKDWKSDKKYPGYCGDGFGKKSNLPGAKAKFLAALGDLDKLIARNRAAHEEAIKQQNLKLVALTANQTRQYVYKRLFANYKGYIDRSAGKGSVADFCANYESENRRDARFGRTNFPGQGIVSMYAFKDNKQWQHAEFGLTEAEYKAMSMYVGNYYHRINEPLWKHEALGPELTLYKEVLDSALKKLPTFTGAPLKRHLTLPQAAIDVYKLNEIVTYDSYTSTTKKMNWGWGGNAKMIIYGGKNSKDVSKFNDGEQEVIFLPGTRFKVIGKETANGATNFVLGEVDDYGDLVARLPVPADYAP